MKKKIIPLTIAVCTPPYLTREAAQLSRVLKREGGLYALGAFSIPHITLYRGHFPAEHFAEVKRRLRRAVRSFRRFRLDSRGYRQNGLGYVDIAYVQTRAVIALQAGIISALNPLREGMRDERELKIISTTGRAQQNDFARYGYDFIGKHFIPHLTLSKFTRPHKNTLRALAPADFSFEVREIGIFAPGREHTCRRLVTAFPLAR